MNWMKYNLLLVSLLCVAVTSHASDSKNFTKERTETFSVKEGALLNLENKYGTVTINTWDRQEMEVHLVIKVKTSSESKAEDIFDMIEVTMSGDEYGVEVATVLDTDYSSGSWWDKMFGNSYDGKYEINYEVKVPKASKLMVVNKYGHLYVKGDMAGKATLVNKYGNIYTQNIAGDVRLQLGYGTAKVGNVHNLDLEVKYSKVQIGDAIQVQAETKYSGIKLGVLSSLESTTKYDNYTIAGVEILHNAGKYDDFNIGSAGKLSIDSKYTDVHVQQLQSSLRCDGKYTTVVVHECTPAVERIAIEGRYTTVSIMTAHPFSLVFEGEDISPRLPDDFQAVEHSRDGDDTYIRGHRGGRGGAEISAKMDEGSFKIREY